MSKASLLVVMTLAAVSVLSVHCAAQTDPCAAPIPGRIFCDDFNDGNILDGLPGTWLPAASPGGTRDASSGDFVVTHSGAMSTYVQELNGIQDLSIRTRLNFSDTSGDGRDEVNIFVRSPLTPDIDDPAGYAGGINTDGVIWLYYVNSDGVGTNLGSTNTAIDPVNNDAFLQFDVFGNELSLTAWQDGQSKPRSSQLTTTDNRLTEGGQVGFQFHPQGGSDSATLRYYEVVPEPSSALLAGLGLLGVGMWRRRGRA